MTFLFQSLLTFGLPLVALPLLIHLINLRRHRRVQWAAMEFLLESQKRNKKWILLRQLLLLLLRTMAVALVVMMLAGPVLLSQWGSLLGSGTTHHVLLVDDSYSMSDRSQDTSAWDQAKQAVGRILQQANAAGGRQQVSLLRFSQAADYTAGEQLPFADRALNPQSADEIDALLEQQAVTQTAAGPLEACQAALKLPEPTSDESRIVYLVSDFRSRQWLDNPETKQVLNRLQTEVAGLHLVQCVEEARPNLAVTLLEPESGLRSAGVETWMHVSVRNFSEEPVESVPVGIVQDGHNLSAVEFEQIGPGEEVTRRFRVVFPSAGPHELVAQLPSDPVAADNSRFFACLIPNSYPLLLIDGSPDALDASYYQKALSPSGIAKPGWSPRVEPPSYLRNHEALADHAAIFLFDVARLDASEVTALEEYVRHGGGLGVFLGPNTQRTFYNEHLFRDGTGLLPMALDLPTQLVSGDTEQAPDVEVADHPVFRVFAGQRNSFLAVAQVNFYFAVEPQVSLSQNVRVLAELRNGAPFVVEKEFGEGRVVVQLCKLSPKTTPLGVWSNWALNPFFPVVANELAGYLSATHRQFNSQEVGESLQFTLPEADYQPEVRIHAPGRTAKSLLTLAPPSGAEDYEVDAGRGDVSGVWQFGLDPRADAPEYRVVAVNVAPNEGDLDCLDRSGLAKCLEGIDYQFALASEMSLASDQLAGFHMGDTMLVLLVLALVIEQWLAYRASYHGRPAGGPL